jgi:hypothetical protein
VVSSLSIITSSAPDTIFVGKPPVPQPSKSSRPLRKKIAPATMPPARLEAMAGPMNQYLAPPSRKSVTPMMPTRPPKLADPAKVAW